MADRSSRGLPLAANKVLGPGLREALLTQGAILATLACVLAIDAEAGPAVMAVVLAMTLSRSQLDRDLRGRLEAAVTLPLVGLLAMGTGWLLREWPLAGAALFVVAMAASIWLRRFGFHARRIGSLLALPMVALLMIPHIASVRLGPLAALLMPVAVGLIALLWVSLFHALGRRLGWLSPPAQSAVAAVAPPQEGAPRLPASTRMSVQMAAALGLAFAVGFAFFPQRWAWLVLTAYIVNSGNRGRGDVAYKSVLRIAGAAAGTLAALLIDKTPGVGGTAMVVWMLVAVFLGLWLRPLGYAWWALFVTLALALLQRFTGAQATLYLWPRLQEILIGAVIGVAAAWWVLPVRSLAVLRLRLANALAALSEALDPSNAASDAARFVMAIDELEQLAPTFRAWRWVSRRWIALQPADWIDTLRACTAPAVAAIEAGQPPRGLRSEIGQARRALREPAQLLPALKAVQKTLQQHRHNVPTRDVRSPDQPAEKRPIEM